MSLLPKLPVSARRAMRFALAIGILGLLVLKLNNAKPFERLAATKPIFVLLAISRSGYRRYGAAPGIGESLFVPCMSRRGSVTAQYCASIG